MSKIFVDLGDTSMGRGKGGGGKGEQELNKDCTQSFSLMETAIIVLI